MTTYTILESYNLILIRYNEIWLKSMKVKIRMLKMLMNNLKNLFNRSGVRFTKYQLSKDSSRVYYFFKNVDIPKALEILPHGFGIHSFSPALRTSNKLKNIIEKAIEVGKEIFTKGDTFAIRAKRSGKHDFSSLDIGVQAGQAILDSFPDLNLKVNLSAPKKKIFIEVRGEFSYIFTDIIRSVWGGPPSETRKKIIAMDVGRLEDILAGFLLMRRGAFIYPVLFNLTNEKKKFDIRLKNWEKVAEYFPRFNFILRIIDLTPIISKIILNLDNIQHTCAICRLIRFNIISKLMIEFNTDRFNAIRAITDGVNLNHSSLCNDEVDLQSISLSNKFFEHPVFTPNIGMDSAEINDFISKISIDLKSLNYCQFRPENQQFNREEINNLYDSLNLDNIISDCLEGIKEINILEKRK